MPRRKSDPRALAYLCGEDADIRIWLTFVSTSSIAIVFRRPGPDPRPERLVSFTGVRYTSAVRRPDSIIDVEGGNTARSTASPLKHEAKRLFVMRSGNVDAQGVGASGWVTIRKSRAGILSIYDWRKLSRFDGMRGRVVHRHHARRIEVTLERYALRQGDAAAEASIGSRAVPRSATLSRQSLPA